MDCGNRVGTDCEDIQQGDCCNAATDDEGDAIGPWKAADAYINGGSDSWTLNTFSSISDDPNACETGVAAVSGSECSKTNSDITGGIATVPNQKRDRNNKTGNKANLIKRNVIAVRMEEDGIDTYYKIPMTHLKYKNYKTIMNENEREDYIIENWIIKVRVNTLTKKVIDRVER